jgi:FMN-dependent NADH-azoreductase
MTLYRLDASIRTDGSHSREIADLVESEWRSANPRAEIIRRHIGT